MISWSTLKLLQSQAVDMPVDRTADPVVPEQSIWTGHTYLAGQAHIAWGAATFLHLKGPGSNRWPGLGDLQADRADAGCPGHRGECGPDQELVQVSQCHQEVLACGRLPVRPAPEFLGVGDECG